MDQFTCISCHVKFADGDIQRLHYKSDWHRYNLKRKVAELPPVTAEEFKKRVLLRRSENEFESKDTSVYCKTCRKSFGTQNAFNNHLNSKRHKENSQNDSIQTVDVKASTAAKPKSNGLSSIPEGRIVENDDDFLTDSEIEEVDSDEWDEDTENPIERNDCMFCLHHSRTLLKNIKHMTIAHTFFIPDVEYCTDIRGLLCYLGEKIHLGYMCLWCNEKGRTFHTADAATRHMIDKGHCKMLHEGLALAEYAPYYDYSSSYPDHEDDKSKDEEMDVPELDGSDYQLVLPSGNVIGHRSLMRYYKQSINPNRAIVVSRNTKKLHKVLVGYRALGWTETQQEQAARKARDLHHMKRLQSKYHMKLGVKSNKFQPHFRQQVNF